MTETPQVVVRSRRSEPQTPKEFKFPQSAVRSAGLPADVQAFRQEAWEAFQATPIPTIKEEAWRRTDLRGLHADQFKLPETGAYKALEPVPAELLKPLTADQHGGQIVLLPGGSQIQLDPDLEKKGVVFTDLRTAEAKHAAVLAKSIGKIVHPKEGKFAGLAGALAQTGVLLYVPKGVIIDQPLHSLLWGAGANLAHLSHIIVYLEEGAAVTYVHESASPKGANAQTLHAGIVEIHVGPSASLRFVGLQSWGENIWNFSHERVRVENDGNLDWIFGAVGSHLTKNFSELDLVGQGATGRMSGFYFTDGNQHLDHDTQQNHLAPHTTSDLLFKGALLGESRSVWQGMIYVAPGAAKTDGYQANRNMVLSSKARADSIPGLEILADDVRCTHGATVGKIDQDLVFYLMSRGMPRMDAERLVVEGFFDPIMQRIPFEGVRARFQDAITEKMNAYQG